MKDKIEKVVNNNLGCPHQMEGITFDYGDGNVEQFKKEMLKILLTDREYRRLTMSEE